ncbi:VOC family protein [Candidatus Bipolaricaulota bacterium]|nr:VOC family protein [Candidatus Bipolaricaulota bacterium]
MLGHQGWAVIVALAPRSFLGLVDGARGHLRPQPETAVLVTLVSDDLAGWRDRLAAAGGTAGMTPLDRREDLGIERFLCRDPGGYAIEVQRFLRPDDRRTFHEGPVELSTRPTA